MKVDRALADALSKLESGGGSLAASSFGESQQRALDGFARRSGAIQRQPGGRGSIYCVRDWDVFRQALRSLRPFADADGLAAIPRRAANVGRMRDSKDGRHQHSASYVLLKSAVPDVCWSNGIEVLDLGAATRSYGAAVLSVTPEDHWRSLHPLWLVENQALFDSLEWMPDECSASVAYYAGQLSGRFLAWLASEPRASEIVHFPDYDGVGLRNYARLKRAVGGSSRFWLMPDWHLRLKRFGNAALWDRTRADFEIASTDLSGSVDPGLQELLLAMAREGLALEHEAVWLPVD